MGQRQSDHKLSPAQTRRPSDTDGPIVLYDNLFYDCKAKTGAIGFGRKIRLEHPLSNLFGHSWTVILNRDYGRLRLELRTDEHSPSSTRWLVTRFSHSLNRISHEVDQHPAHELAVERDQNWIVWDLPKNLRNFAIGADQGVVETIVLRFGAEVAELGPAIAQEIPQAGLVELYWRQSRKVGEVSDEAP
jgi:hypothetical protein